MYPIPRAAIRSPLPSRELVSSVAVSPGLDGPYSNRFRIRHTRCYLVPCPPQEAYESVGELSLACGEGRAL